MRRVDNPELKRQVLNHLAGLYKIKEVRESNHLSSYVTCRTRTFLDQRQAAEPTDEEVMLFALGFGLQDVLTPKNMEPIVYTYEDVIYSPDMSFTPTTSDIQQLIELKTTRKSARYHYMDDSVPVTWLDYMMGGCKIRGTTQYDLVVLYMMGDFSPPFPVIYCDTFTFEEEEIDANWEKITYNKGVLDAALADNIPPTPFANCYDWECKYCRYKLVCETIVNAQRLKEDQKLWD